MEVQTERNYMFGDKFISITMRNPLAVSSYVVSGANKAFSVDKRVPIPANSQYIIRQQRNVSRLKK